MGGSSPHCLEAGSRSNGGVEDSLARSAFSRGKRVQHQNGGFGAYNGRNEVPTVLRGHGFKPSKGEFFCVKGRALLFRILVTAVALWLLFQIVVVLDAASAAKRLEWRDGLALQHRFSRLPHRIVTNVVAQKLRRNHLELHRQNSSFIRSPRVALVCPHVGAAADSLLLITLAKGLQLLDYKFELYAFMDGSMHSAWKEIGVPVTLLEKDPKQATLIEWSRFEGVLAISFTSRYILSSLLQEPFKSLPLIWILHKCEPLKNAENPSEQRSWKQLLQRSKAVVFPNVVPESCSALSSAKVLAVPGSPFDAWEAEKFMFSNDRQSIRSRLGIRHADFVVAFGSSSSNEIWRAHALTMHAVAKLVHKEGVDAKLFVLGNNDSHQNYAVALRAMATQFGFSNGSTHFIEEERANEVLWAADVFAYVSVAEETFFPPILIRAMAFGRLVVVPGSQAVQHYILDGINGLLYSKEDYNTLSNRLLAVKRSGQQQYAQVASAGRSLARNLLAREAVVGYAELLEATIEFPSEVSLPKTPSSVPSFDWAWNVVGTGVFAFDLDRNDKDISAVLRTPEANQEDKNYEEIGEDDIVQEKVLQLTDALERVEEEEVQERREQAQATFEDVNRGVKKAEREKFEFHERDDGELERTGQPLCIYEPYYGAGAWPFLHQNVPLYRGLSLSSRGRRPRSDDVDAVARLPLLNDTYYRDVLCEFGGFLAIANRVDRIHKNSWIGFQPWSVVGRKLALSQQAETTLVEDVKAGTHGDAVYFWVRTDTMINRSSDFWTMCDTRNAGSCRRIFLETFKRMYGLNDEAVDLPVMPETGVWSGMHSWAMHTSSFMEFVLFSRMFIDSLDALLYVEHHNNGRCCLGSTKLENQHCYCRMLEYLVNVWAYHSARRLIYIDPVTGMLEEQHPLENRRGSMKINWFSMSVLKGMDEDMAEKADDEHPNERWLWPHTGEVFWQGILERERQERYNMKLEKKRRNKERLARMRSRYKQKSLGRYVKPLSDATSLENTTSISSE